MPHVRFTVQCGMWKRDSVDYNPHGTLHTNDTGSIRNRQDQRYDLEMRMTPFQHLLHPNTITTIRCFTPLPLPLPSPLPSPRCTFLLSHLSSHNLCPTVKLSLSKAFALGRRIFTSSSSQKAATKTPNKMSSINKITLAGVCKHSTLFIHTHPFLLRHFYPNTTLPVPPSFAI